LQFNAATDTQILSVTNFTAQNIKWIVRTNAIYEIRACPAQGTLSRGETVEIKVTLNGDCVILPDADNSNDKLAIDYEVTGSIRERHKRQRLQSYTKKRYQFDILYNF
ncbi:MSP domain protein, partial [Teladorsagia circumcincta]